MNMDIKVEEMEALVAPKRMDPNTGEILYN